MSKQHKVNMAAYNDLIRDFGLGITIDPATGKILLNKDRGYACRYYTYMPEDHEIEIFTFHITMITNAKATFCGYNANNYVNYNYVEMFNEFAKNYKIVIPWCQTCITRHNVEDPDNFSPELQLRLMSCMDLCGK